MTPLGVSDLADAVYRIALTDACWSIEDLVRYGVTETAASEAEVRTALRELVGLRLLQPSSERPDTDLRVAAPRVALDARVTQFRKRLQEGQDELDRASQQLAVLHERYEAGREANREHNVERLTGLDAVRSRLEQLAQHSELEALSFMRGAQSPESMLASWPLDRDALSRGVNLRSIYLHSALNDRPTAAYMRSLDDSGGETRTVATLPLQMLIVDRRTAVIPVDHERSTAGALVIRSRGALAALLALFESVWQTARALGEPRRTGSVDMSDTEREILRILTTGATDEVVARQLAVSVRTVRRLTSVLMTRFQAQSRFDLGVRVGQQGWGPGGASAPTPSVVRPAPRPGDN